MGFLKAIQFSIYNPEFYSKIKTQTVGSALKYFFLLGSILVFLNTAILFYEVVIKIPGEIKNFISNTVNSYPSDLEIVIDEGQVSTNAQEPFFVPFPQDDPEGIENNLNNILVIDTKTPFSATQFDQYKTLFWLTRDSLFYQNRDFDQRSFDLSKFDNVTINRSFIQNIINQVNPWLNLIGPILLIIVFAGLFIGFVFNLLYLLILAVPVFLLSSIFKWGLNYSDSFKVTIYASTLAFIVDLILFNTAFYTGFYGFPYLFTLITLCIATINLQNSKQKS